MTDHWKSGPGESFIYTTDREFAVTLRKEFGAGATYQRDGHAFAWSFIIPNNRLKFFDKLSDTEKTDFSNVVPQRVTDGVYIKDRLRATNGLNSSSNTAQPSPIDTGLFADAVKQLQN